jgi:NAD(P)-dependent dehydrogenase (short-subunit alcohol dehydrogenase family)
VAANEGQESAWPQVASRPTRRTSEPLAIRMESKIRHAVDPARPVTEQMKLHGRKALVTGSDTGIGLEIGREFARQGADVVFHYVRDDSSAAAAVEEACLLGRKAAAFRADFNHLEEAVGLAERALKFLGTVNCLVNNAGVTFNRPFPKVTPAQFEAMFHINFRAQYFITQKIVEGLLQRGEPGVVCNISSIHALQGVPEHSLYAATKGAIVSYTRALAVELANRGIRVNSIAPGWVTVEGYFHSIPGFTEEMAKVATFQSIPVAHGGTPSDIAKLAAFLCSDDASYIVGQTLVADGGTTALMSLVKDFRKESDHRFGAGFLPDT